MGTAMLLTVLCATGGVGQHIVRHGLADGHQVTAVVRDAGRLSVRHENLSVLRADALDASSLNPVFEGADAVLSGIGAAGRRDPLKPASSSARAAVKAMIATGVRRIIVVSAGPLNRSGTGQSILSRRVFSPLLWAILRDTYTDLAVMEDVLRDSDLDWTSVRPSRLTNKPGLGRYRDTPDAGPAGNSIARADVARAMLDFVAAPQTYRRAIGVSR